MAQVNLSLLGAFQLRVADQTLATMRRKTKALLGYLAVTGSPHTRYELANLFCQEAAAPQRTLRLLLSRSRRALGTDGLLTIGEDVELNQEIVSVDVQQFSQILRGDLAQTTQDDLQQAVDRYHGELLEGLSLPDAPEFELWLLGQRAQMQQLYERGLTELIRRLIDRKQLAAAIPYAQKLNQSNPLLEDSHAFLLWLYAQTGQRESALAQYEKCRTLLWQELAVEPTPELQTLYADLVAGQLGPSVALRGAQAAALTATRTPADFVGRDDELAQLQQWWQAAASGQGQVIMIDGVAGGGKTRLVKVLAEQLAQGQFSRGNCFESTATLPFHPWGELFEQLLGQFDRSFLAQLPAYQIEAAARLVPGLWRRLGRKRPVRSASSTQLERLFAALSDCLLALVAERPLCLFLDDLQWADETSLQLFQYVARRVAQVPLLLLGTYRREEKEDAPALLTLLSDLQRQPSQKLSLPPLAAPAIDQLTSHIWRKLPVGYRSHIVKMIAQTTGGNPLFVVEVLNELAHTEQLPSEIPVPATVRDLIQRRLQQVPMTNRQVLETLAILDRPAGLRLSQQVSGRSEDETVTAIEQGLQRGLLQALPDSRPTRYQFHHDLVRQAVSDQLATVRCELLHRRCALALAERNTAAATLAYHWQMAGDAEQEAHFAQLAGEQAAATFANSEAIHYFTRALELVPETDYGRRYALLLARVQVNTVLGERQAQHEDLLAITDLIDSLPASAVERPQWSAEVNFRKAEYFIGLSQFTEGLAAATQTVHFAQQIPSLRLEGDGYLQWGVALWKTGDFLEAREKLLMSRQLAQENEWPDLEALCLQVLGSVSWSLGEQSQAGDYFAQALPLLRQEGDRVTEGSTLNNLGVIAHDQGDYTQAEDYYQQAIDLQQGIGYQRGVANSVGNLGGLWLELGEWEKAAAYLNQAITINRTVGDVRAVSLQLGDVAKVALHHGQADEALAIAQQAYQSVQGIEDRPSQAGLLNVLGQVYLARGELDEAAAVYEQAYQIRQEVGQHTSAMEPLAGLAQTLLAASKTQAALAHVETILQYLDGHSLDGTLEPIRIYLTCYEVLNQLGDPRTNAVLHEGYEQLQTRAAKINDPDKRQAYLHNVPAHQRLLTASGR